MGLALEERRIRTDGGTRALRHVPETSKMIVQRGIVQGTLERAEVVTVLAGMALCRTFRRKARSRRAFLNMPDPGKGISAKEES